MRADRENPEATPPPLAERKRGGGGEGGCGGCPPAVLWSVVIAVSIPCLVIGIMLLTSINVLDRTEQILIKGKSEWTVVNGPGTHFVWSGRESERREALILKDGQYAVVADRLAGTKEVYTDTGTNFLSADQVLERVEDSPILGMTQYIVVTDNKDATKRVVRGPARYMPCAGFNCAMESLGPITDCRIITLDTALLVKNTENGVLELKTEVGPFFPTAYEEVEEERSLIRVSEFESVVVELRNGQYEFHEGTEITADGGGGVSFFLPEYASVVTHSWTIGGATEVATAAGARTTQSLQKIDRRVQQLFFEYDDVRTNDNIEFEVEGTIFWQVSDVRTLLSATADPTADIWHRLRAKISHAAGSYDYAGFLGNLKNMTTEIKAKEMQDDFYTNRGIILHDLELIEVELKDEELERNIVDAMAMEAIDRINRVEQEISEAEVAVVALNGAHDIEMARAQNEQSLALLNAQNALVAEQNTQDLLVAQQSNAQSLLLEEVHHQLRMEKARGALLNQSDYNRRQEAETAGMAKGVEMAKAVSEFWDGTAATIVDGNGDTSSADQKTLFEMHMDYESKDVTSSNLAGGEAKLFLAPEAASLNLGSPISFADPGAGR